MKEIILDTETTGLEVKDGHRIVEIGCVELENQIPTNKIFHYYLNPQRKVSENAFKVHGYTDDFLSKQKKFSEICDDFLNFIEGKILIIHNADFDLNHLNNELALLGKRKIDRKNVIDTLELAKDKYPGSQVSLDALCKRFRIDNSKREKHSAIIDCKLLSKVYINLIDQKEPTFDFKSIENKKVDFIKNNISYCKKIILPNENEINNHKEYLKTKLNKNFF
tara:strand:- start:636 stop:1301 length:666 start_codon:yes stop_codon:yes gene_type:complete